MSKTLREQSLDKLENFINHGLQYYSSKRNFDLGLNDKSNVSCLSPYISHRLDRMRTQSDYLFPLPCFPLIISQ